ncbi:MAG TPA: nucleotidyltransferase family protein [Rhodanobacteraceae bacterium]|nr:nucleotidyltransferase family protein [Rhodanobacteraceae bacterium]
MTDCAFPRHGAIVLAAGDSRRLGQAKQWLRIDGEALLHRAARLALATAPADCVIVLGADAGRMAEAVGDLPVRCVGSCDHRDGMASSLRAGLHALDVDCAAALVLLTDQPLLDVAHLLALRERWRAQPLGAVASGYAGIVGVPALLPRRWFDALMRLEGDRGARAVLRERAAEVSVIAAPGLARDIDLPDDLTGAQR